MSENTTVEDVEERNEPRNETAEEVSTVTFSQLVRDHQNAYIRVADNKASILLTGLVAYLGLSLNVVGSNLSEEGLIFFASAVVSVLSAIIAIYYAAQAVYPSTPSTPQGLIMWESIVEKGEEEYQDTIRSKSSDELLNELIDENYQLAKVNYTKYKQVRRALLATIPAVACGILGMVILIA